MWGFTRYNVIVQQVEGVSDVLRRVADRIEPLAGADPDHVAPLLVSHLREIVGHLDRRALAMLAHYDPTAAEFVAGGEVRDPRRGAWVREPVQTSPKLLKPATRKRKRLVI
jgi:hypothetical protein